MACKPDFCCVYWHDFIFKTSCWRARGAGMGWLVKGPRSNPDEELGNRECGNQVLSSSPEEFVSQELCQDYLVDFENAQQRKVPGGFTGVPPFSMEHLRCWKKIIKVLTFKWFSIHSTMYFHILFWWHYVGPYFILVTTVSWQENMEMDKITGRCP